MLDFFPFPFIICLATLALLLFLLWHRKSSVAYLTFVFVFGLYLIDAVRLTIFPLPLPAALGGIITSPSPAAHILSQINLTPFDFGGLFSASSGVIFANLVGNLLLTLPFGFGIHFILKSKTPIEPRRFLWMAFLPGLAVELAQLGISLAVGAAYRGVDINDVILNAIGTWMGYGLFRLSAWGYRMVAANLRKA